MRLSKKSIYKIIGVAVIVAIPFLWCEHFSLSAKLNYQKFAAYFGILAAIGTTASLYLVYKQIQVAAKSHQPNITVSDLHFFMQLTYVEGESKPVITLTNDSFEKVDFVSYLITNSGTATAFDIVSVIQGFLRSDLKELVMTDSKLTEKLDVGKSTGVRISTPLINYIVKLALESKKHGVASSFETHLITLTIKYVDNEDSPFEKKFRFEIMVWRHADEFYVRILLTRLKK